MSAGLDPSHIRRAFGRAATTYEAHAVLQAEVGERLRERLDGVDFSPIRVVDVGSGPGGGSAALHRRFDDAFVIALDLALPMLQAAAQHAGMPPAFARVCADAQALPLADASVDLVHSNLCLQWCEDPGLALAEFRRVLRPGGHLLFSTFGPDTLKELRAAFATADATPHVSRFIDMHDIGDALVRAGLTEPVLDVERVTLTYPDVLALMRDLKVIGAHNVTAGRPRGLVGRGTLRRVEAAYESARRSGLIPATYEVVYGAAWGCAGKRAASLVEGEVRISPSSIRRRGDGERP